MSGLTLRTSTPKGELDVRQQAGGGSGGGGTAARGVFLLGGDGDEDNGSGAKVTQQPKNSDPFWVNPDGNAAAQVAAYVKAGKDDDAEQIRKIAQQPTAEWIGPENPEQEARGFTEAAEKADRDAVLVLYNIPHRDCDQFSQGGAADGNAYRTWIDGVAKGIADRPATVILEPDAVLHLVDQCTPRSSTKSATTSSRAPSARSRH